MTKFRLGFIVSFAILIPHFSAVAAAHDRESEMKANPKEELVQPKSVGSSDRQLAAFEGTFKIPGKMAYGHDEYLEIRRLYSPSNEFWIKSSSGNSMFANTFRAVRGEGGMKLIGDFYFNLCPHVVSVEHIVISGHGGLSITIGHVPIGVDGEPVEIPPECRGPHLGHAHGGGGGDDILAEGENDKTFVIQLERVDSKQ